MKILHITKKFPPALGGDAVVVQQLRRQQQATGHQVVIVTSNCEEVSSQQDVYKIGLTDNSARLDTITLRRLLSLILLGFHLFVLLRRERPDVIHTHSVDMAFVGSFAARWYRIPCIHTFHIVTFYDPIQSVVRRKTELWLAKRAHPQVITAPNMYDVKQLRAAGLTQAKLLPNGVDMEYWRVRRQHTGKSFVFLSVGRLEQQKGYEYLITAAEQLRREGIESFRVLIVGEGSQRRALERCIHSAGLKGVVKLLGRKSPGQVRSLLGRCDAAIFASLYETTPLTLLEAWAAAIPVITTPVGILREAVAGFGGACIVPLRSVPALKEAMATWIQEIEKCASVATSGYAQVVQYTWPEVAKRAESLYRSVL